MIWCIGMYGSASTWAFNAVTDTARTLLPGINITPGYAETLQMLTPFQTPDGLQIIKTHHLPGNATDFLASRASRIVITIRDPRDVVTSMMQRLRLRLPGTIAMVEQSALFCAKFAKDQRAVVLRYETAFFDDPEILDQFAGLFNKTLNAAQRRKIFEQSRRDIIDAKIARLHELPTSLADPRSGDVVDTQTQWHTHHGGRTGEIGRWQRMLPVEAVSRIEQRLGPWMQQFGYQPR
jgi:hypothetical protein